jgi:hypothetical protein
MKTFCLGRNAGKTEMLPRPSTKSKIAPIFLKIIATPTAPTSCATNYKIICPLLIRNSQTIVYNPTRRSRGSESPVVITLRRDEPYAGRKLHQRQTLLEILVVQSVFHPWLFPALRLCGLCRKRDPANPPTRFACNRPQSYPPNYSPRFFRTNQKPCNRLHEIQPNYSPLPQDFTPNGEQFADLDKARIDASLRSTITC